ncbi:MAG TPA: DMT family transporter [Pyrinomonadaceae bacterium]|jgi:drug/metabolite transporter (DMT)-like permease
MRLRANLAADGALVGTTLLWGSTFVVAKDILDYWPAVAYLALRMSLAASILCLLFWKHLRRAGRSEWRAGAILGMLIGVGFVGQTVGLSYTTPSKSAFVTGLTTPLVPFVALLLLRVRPSTENLIGVALASLGGALILAPQDAGGVNTGDLITLACTVIFAFHITLMSRYAQRQDPRQLTAMQITVAASLIVLAWLAIKLWVSLFGASALPPGLARNAGELVWSGRVLWQLLYLTVFATIVTFLLWTWGQARMSATHAAIIFSLEPVFATLFAMAVRGTGEWLGARASVGAAMVLAGVLVSELRWSDARAIRFRRRRADTSADTPENEDDVEINFAESNDASV